jgi:hypothetical protein
MTRRPLLLLATAAFTVVGLAHAQTESLSSVTARLDTEVPCLERARRRLDDTVRLLGEARTQLGLPRTSPAARRDALVAVEALEARVREIVPELRRCVPAHGPTDTVVEEAPALPVETENDATVIVERGGRLGRAHLVVGERVDGLGRVDASAIQRAIRSVAPSLDACVDAASRRGAPPRGNVNVVFTVQPDGSTTNARTEALSFGDSTFASCMRDAVARIQARSPARGGSATYSYTLRY